MRPAGPRGSWLTGCRASRPRAPRRGDCKAEGGPGRRRGGSQGHAVRLPGNVFLAEVISGLGAERLTLRYDALDDAVPYVAGTPLAVRKASSLRGLVRGLDRLIDLGG